MVAARRKLHCGVIWILLLALTGPSRAAESDNLYLAEIRFHAVQQDHFSALVDLLVAMERGRVNPQAPAALELLGRLQLGFGLHEDARATLDRVLESASAGDLHQQVWFTVAVDAWQRQDQKLGLKALSHIGAGTSSSLTLEVDRLRAQMAMREGRFDEGARLLRPLAGDTADPLLRFNLAVALLRLGRHDEAEALLGRLAELQSFDEAARTLRDQAAYRLGLSLASRGQLQQALAPLESVRLHGPLGTRALLASGQVLQRMNQPEQSLVPWKVLRQRTVLDPAVQEAWVRIAETQYRLRRHQDAAYDLDEAIDAFDRALRQTADARKALGDGRLLTALRSLNRDVNAGAAWMNQLLSAVPESRVLGQALASGRFQREIRVHREIRFLQLNLRARARDLLAFESMLGQHAELFDKRAPWIGEKLDALDLGGLKNGVAQLRERLTQIEQAGDTTALTSAAERDWFDHLRRVEAHLPQLPEAERESLQARIRLLRARVIWSREIGFETRLQALREGLDRVATGIEDAGREVRLIQRGRDTAPATIERRRQQLSAFKQRLADLQPRVDAALQAQEKLLLNLASEEIDHVEQRLRKRLAEARILLARNYDDALRATADP